MQSDEQEEEEEGGGGGGAESLTNYNNDNDDQEGLEDTPTTTGKKIKSRTKNNVRETMKMARDQALGSNNDNNDHNDNDDNEKEESLETLKQQILGRSISSMYDIDHTSEQGAAALLSSSNHHHHHHQEQQQQSNNKLIMDASTTFTDGATVAHHLKQDLTCPICHDRLYNPVSLLCGHSFCQVCLNWWLEKKGQQEQQQRMNDAVDEAGDAGDYGDLENHGENRCGTCPSCREPIPNSNDKGNNNNNRPNWNIQINTALKSVLDTLYGSEMNQRRLAEERQKLKAQSGEMGGLHTRGCEEIVPLPKEENELDWLLTSDKNNGHYGVTTNRDDEENGWISLYASATTTTASSMNQQQQGSRRSLGYSSQRSGSGGSSSISIRRNVVLDDCDQRYQLSLGLTRCTYSSNISKNSISAAKLGNGPSMSGGVLDIELCLLAMEEDEVDDSGFPTFVNEGDDDEALICTGSDRIHTCIESSVRVVPTETLDRKAVSNVFGSRFGNGGGGSNNEESRVIREVTLSRGMIGRDGSVRFRIDMQKALESATMMGGDEEQVGGGAGGGGDDDDDNGKKGTATSFQVVKLRFRHVDTGAVLELRLPSKSEVDEKMQGGSDDEIEFCGVKKQPVAKNDASRYLLNDDHYGEEHSDDEPNEYQEDDFLVHGTQDSDEFDSNEEEEHGDDDVDDDGECEICKNGGDLIVCDGGDHEGGCGHMYHVHCIGRGMIPPGDWICNTCANDLGMDVGIKGHEWEVDDEEEDVEKADEEEEDEETEATKSKPLVIDDSDDDESIAPAVQIKKKPLVIDDSDDDESIAPAVQNKKKGLKRKILETPESDDSGLESEDDDSAHKRVKSE
ncbi:hypothetical protein ACHAXR_012042 [Thalassiosira sp. AJA248-18]